MKYDEEPDLPVIKDPDGITDDSEWRLQALHEPLEGDCEVELITFDEEAGKKALWHSSAHMLGAAVEKVFKEPLLTIGPPIADGFYYDFFSESGQVVTG